MPQPLLLGHRGASRYAPENTLAAFDLALAHGCDGFEFDVRMSADQHPIIVHDPRLHDIVIADLAAEKLFALRSALPPMGQVFERYAATAFLNVELKVVGLERRVVELLETYPPERGLLISSFLPEVVRSLQELAPHVPIGYVCRRPDLLAQWRRLPITHAVLHYSLATRAILDELRDEGKKVFVWTVNQREEIVEMAALGVDGIISDDTRLLGDLLRPRRIEGDPAGT